MAILIDSRIFEWKKVSEGRFKKRTETWASQMSWKRLGGEEVGQNSVRKIYYFTVKGGLVC